MSGGISALTERERETLRLLYVSHDAKSIARTLGLSVHTVNERLRDARRKLGLSSSREAARLLADAEQTRPDFFGDKQFGVAVMQISRLDDDTSGAAHRIAWLGGGMLVMSLIIAAIVLSSGGAGGAHGPPAQSITANVSTPARSSPAPPIVAPAERPARQWLALLDGARWEESWRATATLFRSQLPAAQWSATIRPVREPFGRVLSRTLKSVTKASALPGAPAGEYEVLQFETAFAHKSGAIETITLVREPSGWKVAGYFVR
ncbi:MAG: DUF4019 domain-containing protein [Novosphingobium sp.]